MIQTPFSWFGGKGLVAAEIWRRFGRVPNLVIPFFGSGSELLRRPRPFSGLETANDLDGFVCNFFRAAKHDPETVATWADNPVCASDLHARHAWLVGQRESLTARLEGDPDWFDPKIAGWWCWGINLWVGSDWCSGRGSWRSVEMLDGERRLIDWGGSGPGVRRKRPHLADAGRGILRDREQIREYMQALSERLREVRVCCGDWSSVLGPAVTSGLGLTAVILDPPYAGGDREEQLYSVDDLTVAADVRRWAIENGSNPLLRIALCGLDSLEMPAVWSLHRWQTNGGFGSQGSGRGRANAGREVVWFSENCLNGDLFAGVECAEPQETGAA